MTRSVRSWARWAGFAAAIAVGCGGSLGPATGTGGHGGATGTGGLGGAVGTGGLGGDAGGTTGGGGSCAICSDPTADVAGCPAGAASGLLCGVGFPQNGYCCAGSQQFNCNCPPGAPDCFWVATCGGTGGTTGTGGVRGSGGVGGDVGGTTGAGGLATGGTGGTGAGGKGATGSGGQGGVACGGTTCAAGKLCVHPGCAGGVSPCMPVPDGGACPAGWMHSDFCPSLAGPGCVELPCDPPPPFCADVPAACAGAPSCGCLPNNICTVNGGNGGCWSVTTSDVRCGSA